MRFSLGRAELAAASFPRSIVERPWGESVRRTSVTAGRSSDADFAPRQPRPLARKQKSVLDFVAIEDCAALARRARSGGHTPCWTNTAPQMRSMEQNLTSTLPATGMCARPADPGARGLVQPRERRCADGGFHDLIFDDARVRALAHESRFSSDRRAQETVLRRATAFQRLPSPTPVNRGPAHHPWTHQNTTLTSTHDAMRIFTTFYANQVALLVDKLKSTTDASGQPADRFDGSPLAL
jgi:hypothetical protein